MLNAKLITPNNEITVLHNQKAEKSVALIPSYQLSEQLLWKKVSKIVYHDLKNNLNHISVVNIPKENLPAPLDFFKKYKILEYLFIDTHADTEHYKIHGWFKLELKKTTWANNIFYENIYVSHIFNYEFHQNNYKTNPEIFWGITNPALNKAKEYYSQLFPESPPDYQAVFLQVKKENTFAKNNYLAQGMVLDKRNNADRKHYRLYLPAKD